MGHRLLSVKRVSKHSTRYQSGEALTPIFEFLDFQFKHPNSGVGFVQQFAQSFNGIDRVRARRRSATSFDTNPTIDLRRSPIGRLNYLELVHLLSSPMT
jgi:hypothetical protein